MLARTKEADLSVAEQPACAGADPVLILKAKLTAHEARESEMPIEADETGGDAWASTHNDIERELFETEPTTSAGLLVLIDQLFGEMTESLDPAADQAAGMRNIRAAAGKLLGHAAGSAEIGPLWLQMLNESATSREISSAYERAYKALPWWAATGHKWLVAEGCQQPSDTCNWPAIQDLEKPTNRHALRLWRPGPHDIEERRKTCEIVVNEKVAQRIYEKEMAELEARRAAQKAEEERVGLTALGHALDEVAERIYALAEQIEALPASLERVAALTAIEIQKEAQQERCFDDWEERAGFVALKGLLSFISGPVADTVRDIVENPDRAFCLSPLATSCPEASGERT